MQPLTINEIVEKVDAINSSFSDQNAWSYIEGRLVKTLKFNSFNGALVWMNDVAVHIELLNHHPEWLNIYNKVEVKLITHEAKGVTELDFKLAEKMQDLV